MSDFDRFSLVVVVETNSADMRRISCKCIIFKCLAKSMQNPNNFRLNKFPALLELRQWRGLNELSHDSITDALTAPNYGVRGELRKPEETETQPLDTLTWGWLLYNYVLRSCFLLLFSYLFCLL